MEALAPAHLLTHSGLLMGLRVHVIDDPAEASAGENAAMPATMRLRGRALRAAVERRLAIASGDVQDAAFRVHAARAPAR